MKAFGGNDQTAGPESKLHVGLNEVSYGLRPRLVIGPVETPV